MSGARLGLSPPSRSAPRGQGRTTGYAYDALNRVIAISDPLGGTTRFSYDANANLLSVTDAQGNATTYAYNTMDRLERRTDPLTRFETFIYDGNGNLTDYTDRKNQRALFTYDGLNRRTNAEYRMPGGAVESTVQWTYDGGNRLTQVVDSAGGTITNGWDLPIDTKPAKDLQPQGQELLAATDGVQKDGYQLLLRIEGAPVTLVENVDVIIAKINDAIRDTQPNIQGLAAVINGLGPVQPEALKGLGGGTVRRSAQKAKKSESAAELSAAMAEVQAAIDSVSRRRNIIQTYVDISRAVTAPSVASCLAIADAPAAVLRLTPAGDIQIAPGETQRIAVVGGKPPYFASWLKGPATASDISVKSEMDGGAFFVTLQAASNAAVDKEYTLHISDTANATTDKTIKVKK